MTSSGKSRALSALLIVVLFASPCLWAQVSTGSINGNVRDQSGAFISGAEVKVTQTDKQLTRSAVTDSQGAFVFTSLPVGPYTLSVQKDGFSPYRQTGIVLSVAQAVFLPVTLQLGKVAETVNVSADASMVETTTSALSRLVAQHVVESMPLNGRQPGALVFLAAGSSDPVQNVAIDFGGSPILQNTVVHPRETAPAINGVRGNGVYFSLDGATNVDIYTVAGGPFPNPDAVQEFRVVTSSYGAEYVSAPGGAVNIVTRSGGNGFHGTVWEFHRNGVLNARNYFADRHDDLKRNQFGAAVGGPILKDRLFVFGSYEGMRVRSLVRGLTAFVPTDAQRDGDFSAYAKQLVDPATGTPYAGNQIPLSQFDPVSVGLLQYIPHSSSPDGKIQYTRPVAQNDNQGVLRVDFVRRAHVITGRYFVDDYSWPGTGLLNNNLIATFRGQFHRWQNLAFSDSYTHSSSFLNDFRLSYAREGTTTAPGENQVTLVGLGAKGFPAGVYPAIQLVRASGYFDIAPGNFNTFPRETFEFQDHVHMMRGRHQLSFGTQLQYLRAKLLTDNAQNPIPTYTGGLSGNPLSDFLLGRPYTVQQSDGIFVRMRGKLLGFYGEDKIQVSPAFTLTLGVRWDPYFPFTARFGRMACIRPGQQSQVFVNAPQSLVFDGDPGCSAGGTDNNIGNIEPRIGMAYRLDQQGKTVIRSGYGIYTMQFPMMTYLGTGYGQPFSRSFVLIAPGVVSNIWANFPGGSPFVNGFALDDLPRSKDFQFIKPVRAAGLAPNLHMAYVQQWSLSFERSLTDNTSVEASYVGSKGTDLSLAADLNQAIYIAGQSTTGNIQQRRPFKDISNAIEIQDGGTSIYHAIQLTVRHRVKGGLTLDSSLTLGRAIDNVSANGNLLIVGATAGNQIPDPSNPQLRRAVSDFDLGHSWLTSFVWRVPISGQSRLAKALVSGWQFGGVFTLEGGQPFSVTALGGRSLTGNGLEFADLVPGIPIMLSTGRPHDQLVNQYFNTQAFVTNALGTFGNSGRNTLRSPGITNLDLSLSKEISVGEQYRLIFRSEAFNFTNTPHFLPPSAAVGTSQIGRITGARDPRILQFGLKFSW